MYMKENMLLFEGASQKVISSCSCVVLISGFESSYARLKLSKISSQERLYAE